MLNLGHMRLIRLICGLSLSASGSAGSTLAAAQGVIASDPWEDDELTVWEVQHVCPSVKHQSTMGAGTVIFETFRGSVEGIPQEEVEFVGRDWILKCVEATCTDAIESLARAIPVFDPNFTLEGINGAVRAIDLAAARRVFEYTEHLSDDEMADVVFLLYRLAREQAHVEHMAIALTPNDMRAMGANARIVFNGSA